jgi:hypothetical protein
MHPVAATSAVLGYSRPETAVQLPESRSEGMNSDRQSTCCARRLSAPRRYFRSLGLNKSSRASCQRVRHRQRWRTRWRHTPTSDARSANQRRRAADRPPAGRSSTRSFSAAPEARVRRSPSMPCSSTTRAPAIASFCPPLSHGTAARTAHRQELRRTSRSRAIKISKKTMQIGLL